MDYSLLVILCILLIFMFMLHPSRYKNQTRYRLQKTPIKKK